jgi:hypothetical protein
MTILILASTQTSGCLGTIEWSIREWVFGYIQRASVIFCLCKLILINFRRVFRFVNIDMIPFCHMLYTKAVETKYREKVIELQMRILRFFVILAFFACFEFLIQESNIDQN